MRRSVGVFSLSALLVIGVGLSGVSAASRPGSFLFFF